MLVRSTSLYLLSKLHHVTSKQGNTKQPFNNPRITSIKQPKARSALASLVSVTCTLSAIPAYFAWDHAENNPGRAPDSNFLQLLASAPIQLLGIVCTYLTLANNQQFSTRSCRLDTILDVSNLKFLLDYFAGLGLLYLERTT